MRRVGFACALVTVLMLAACGSPASSGNSVVFVNTDSTRHLAAGKYAVAVANECGVVERTMAGHIERGGWSDPLLNGTPVTLPTTGDYTVVDPIASDLMLNTSPCSLSLTVALTPMKP